MTENAVLPDPLNEREQEILERLANGLSDQRIADELMLSLNTIKWYNRQLYSKLGVSSRTQAIAQARALGLIQTAIPAVPTPPPIQTSNRTPVRPRSNVEQRVYFTKSFDGAQIAFAIAGDGPPLVKEPTFMSQLEYDWESPIWRHWLEEFTREHTLIRYDKRGTGLSDWNVTDLSFAAWVRDLEAVVNAIGLTEFSLFANSQGGTVAVAYAAQHPEKVNRLLLFGAYARGWLHRELTDEQIEEEKLLVSLMRIGWGRENPAFRQVFATQLRPEASAEELRAFDELMRISISPENAARLESEMHRTDIRALPPLVTTPTLVLHARGDAGVPFEEGRLLASLIPKAEFVALESKNHLPTENEPAWDKFVSAFRRFLS
jgi:pimeloyl-ACP methyl ester carboxylesterase/DNA-binding CsgD family transcriptional regulator